MARKKSSPTLREINTALPDLKSEKVSDIAIELDKILAIKKLFQSDGGEILIADLRTRCSLALRKALLCVKEGGNPAPFILDWGANMEVLTRVQDISLEEELRGQLDEAVIEASQ
jgi:hypothetical protein